MNQINQRRLCPNVLEDHRIILGQKWHLTPVDTGYKGFGVSQIARFNKGLQSQVTEHVYKPRTCSFMVILLYDITAHTFLKLLWEERPITVATMVTQTITILGQPIVTLELTLRILNTLCLSGPQTTCQLAASHH